MRPRSSKRRCESGGDGTRTSRSVLPVWLVNGSECDFMSLPGDRSGETLLAFFDNRRARSPLIIKDFDLYPKHPTNTRSPTLNSEQPG